MQLNGFDSDDYIYLKVLKDTKLPDGFYMSVNKGTILKYRVQDLKELLLRKRVRDNLDITFNENCSKYSLLPWEVYKEVKSKYSCILRVALPAGTKIPFTPWIIKKFFADETMAWNKRTLSKLYDEEISQITPKDNNMLEIFNDKKVNELESLQENSMTLITLAYTEDFKIPLEKGEILDFNDPGVTLFLSDTTIVNFLASCMLINEEEKLKLFKQEYQNRLPNGYRYFRLRDDIPIEVSDIEKPNFYMQKNNFDFDAYTFVTKGWYGYNKYQQENKNIRYLWVNNDKLSEDEILKIADEVSLAQAQELYKQEMIDKQEYELRQKAILYCLENKRKWQKAKQKNPHLTELDFMQQQLLTLEYNKKVLYQKLINALKHRENILKHEYLKK